MTYENHRKNNQLHVVHHLQVQKGLQLFHRAQIYNTCDLLATHSSQIFLLRHLHRTRNRWLEIYNESTYHRSLKHIHSPLLSFYTRIQNLNKIKYRGCIWWKKINFFIITKTKLQKVYHVNLPISFSHISLHIPHLFSMLIFDSSESVPHQKSLSSNVRIHFVNVCWLCVNGKIHFCPGSGFGLVEFPE